MRVNCSTDGERFNIAARGTWTDGEVPRLHGYLEIPAEVLTALNELASSESAASRRLQVS